jgi:phage shock protein A
MSILSRLSNLVRSNLNAAIDKVSDPGKEIDLLVEQMEEESRRSRLEVRDHLAQEKLAQKRVDEHYRNVQKWQDHAERAVKAGDDELAREALRRREQADAQLQAAEEHLSTQSHLTAKLTEQIRQNDRKIAEIKAKKETLKARARASKQAFSADGSAFDRFDQLASQIDLNEAQAEAMAEMAGDRTSTADSRTNERFDRLLGGNPGTAGQGGEVEDRLAELKARLDKKGQGA